MLLSTLSSVLFVMKFSRLAAEDSHCSWPQLAPGIWPLLLSDDFFFSRLFLYTLRLLWAPRPTQEGLLQVFRVLSVHLSPRGALPCKHQSAGSPQILSSGCPLGFPEFPFLVLQLEAGAGGRTACLISCPFLKIGATGV